MASCQWNIICVCVWSRVISDVMNNSWGRKKPTTYRPLQSNELARSIFLRGKCVVNWSECSSVGWSVAHDLIGAQYLAAIKIKIRWNGFSPLNLNYIPGSSAGSFVQHSPADINDKIVSTGIIQFTVIPIQYNAKCSPNLLRSINNNKMTRQNNLKLECLLTVNWRPTIFNHQNIRRERKQWRRKVIKISEWPSNNSIVLGFRHESTRSVISFATRYCRRF